MQNLNTTHMAVVKNNEAGGIKRCCESNVNSQLVLEKIRDGKNYSLLSTILPHIDINVYRKILSEIYVDACLAGEDINILRDLRLGKLPFLDHCVNDVSFFLGMKKCGKQQARKFSSLNLTMYNMGRVASNDVDFFLSEKSGNFCYYIGYYNSNNLLPFVEGRKQYLRGLLHAEHYETAEAFLKEEDIDTLNEELRTFLYSSVYEASDVQYFDFLVRHGATVNLQTLGERERKIYEEYLNEQI